MPPGNTSFFTMIDINSIANNVMIKKQVLITISTYDMSIFIKIYSPSTFELL